MVKIMLRTIEASRGKTQLTLPLSHLSVPGNFSQPVIRAINQIPAPMMVIVNPTIRMIRPILSKFDDISLFYIKRIVVSLISLKVKFKK